MANIETLQCTVCGEGYTYDDEASPKWASTFCGTACRDTGMKASDDDEDFEDYEPDEDTED